MLIPLLFLAWTMGGLINLLADSLPFTRRPQLPHCHSCGAPYSPVAWLSVSAILARVWRCSYCDSPRNLRAPIVELASILIALSLYHREPYMGTIWTGLIIAGIFLLIVVIDIEHRLILHIVSGPAAIIGGLFGFLDPNKDIAKTILGGAVGLGVVLILFLLGALFAKFVAVRRGDDLDEVAFGFGDVTLAGVIGLTVGWPGVIVALFIGVLIAGEFSMVYIIDRYLRGRYQAYLPIPYGPFLVIGAWIIYHGGPALVYQLFPWGPLVLLLLLTLVFAAKHLFERIKAQ
ncbi:MAG: hypothetical protein GTO14_08690 [Anaerolineales bacterium]|nr:hypothetical protein [Anaerolineales bacterium]